MPLAIGTPLPEYRVRAYNNASDSSNLIHDDDHARRYGFRAGLVPGVSVYAYMSRALVGYAGREWLQNGSAEVRFVQAIYEGEEVHVTGSVAEIEKDGSTRFDFQATSSRGVTCGVGVARLPSHPSGLEPQPEQYPAGTERLGRPISLERLVVGEHLVPISAEFTRRQHWEYCQKMIRDHHPIYERVLHPGWLLTQVNRLLAANYDLPPWIHVGSAVQHHHLQEEECIVETRGTLRDKFERRGHHFLVLDAAIFCGNRCLQTVMHTAIFRIAPRAA